MSYMVFRGAETPLGSFSGFGTLTGIGYFCPVCGELWGKLVFQERRETGRYMVSSRPCELHGNRFSPGGSFYKPLLWWEFDSNEKLLHQRLPIELALHEAMMIINHAEKGLRLI